MQEKEYKMLFLTDIHQNIAGLKRIDFTKYDIILCGGDLLDPSNPDINIAYDIINTLPRETFIVPGNCDKNTKLIGYMKKRLKYVHKKISSIKGIAILGIGYCRHVKDDIKTYRKYFLEDKNRIFEFLRKNKKLSFLVEFCGIKINNNKINVIPENEALKLSKDYIKKFVAFQEEEIQMLFKNISDLSNGIILTHSPPLGYLDKLDGLPHIGSNAIKNGILKTKPRLVLCGHFHEINEKDIIENTIIFNPGALKDNKFGVINFSKNNINLIFNNI